VRSPYLSRRTDGPVGKPSRLCQTRPQKPPGARSVDYTSRPSDGLPLWFLFGQRPDQPLVTQEAIEVVTQPAHIGERPDVVKVVVDRVAVDDQFDARPFGAVDIRAY
jgi:hypothetical protein